MKLRANETCPIHDRDLAVAASRCLEPKFCNQDFGESMTHTIRAATGNSVHERKCESYSIAKSSNRTESVLSAAKSSPTTTMWRRTIKSRRDYGGAWRDDHPDNIQSGTLVVQ